MNKKVSTLLTVALTLGGSLLSSSAFADAKDVKLNIGEQYSVAEGKFENATYFVVQDNDGTLEGTSIVMGFYDATEKDKIETVSETLVADGSNWKISVDNNETVKNYLWKVTEYNGGNGNKYYRLVNVGTGKTLMFNSDEDAIIKDFSTTGAEALKTALQDFNWQTVGAQYAGGSTLFTKTANKTLNLESDDIAVETSGDSKFYLFKVGDVSEGASAFESQKGEFTLDYKIGDDAATKNVFKGVRAIDVKGGEYSAKYPTGTYFVVNAPSDLKDEYKFEDAESGSEDEKAEKKASNTANDKALDKLTFIAVDPANDWNIHELTEPATGMKFKSIRGSQLKKDADEAGQIDVKNACFTVYTNVNNANKVKLSVKAVVNNEDNDGLESPTTVYVAAVEDQDDIFVTTVSDDENYNVWTTISSSNIVEAKSFLDAKSALVYNIKFVSKVEDGGMKDGHEDSPNTYSEYSKYLGIAKVGIAAQGKDYIDLNAPQNQWLVTDATTDNKFTFTNRENGKSFVASLVKTSKDNEYKLTNVADASGDIFATFKYAYEDIKTGDKTYSTGDCNLEGTTVLLSKATVSATAGYVSSELDNVGLVRMSYTTQSAINPVELYLTATDADAKLNKDASKAALFDVVKFDTDTVYKFTDYAVWNATDSEVDYKEKADTVAVVTYAFKLYGADKAYLASGLSIEDNINDVEDAQQFIIKKNADGSQSLIEYTVGNDFEDAIKGANALTADLTDGSISTESIYNDFESYFSIKAEELGNSWNHVPQHVTFADANIGGYIAVGEGSKAILAPTSELKAEYTKEDLTFWLDTTDTDAHVPAFYISKAGKFMYNAYDSAYYFNEGVATDKPNKDYLLPGSTNARAIFCEGTLKDANTLEVTIDGEKEELTSANGLDNFKFNIIENEDGEYLIRSVAKGTYLYNLNAELGFTGKSAAMPVVVEVAGAPTSNEGVAASEVKVVAQDGAVVVKNAAGKNVVVSTILGQVVANEVLTSDNATINVPAGIVVVAVEGESFKVNVK